MEKKEIIIMMIKIKKDYDLTWQSREETSSEKIAIFPDFSERPFDYTIFSMRKEKGKEKKEK